MIVQTLRAVAWCPRRSEEASMEESRSPAQKLQPRPQDQGPDPLIGRMINDRYRILATIARGGMGKVYRAEQQPLGRLVALKVLTPNYSGDSDPEFHKRFFLEASIASKLTHPNTVTIFDYGKTDDEIFYIAMELLEGRTLHRLLREEAPLSADRTMHVARQICRSLREAHNLGVIHRDLKPANVYLLHHGDERDVVKVLDFGLVKNLEDKGEDLTQAGLFMGSPKYMSPEQIRGERCDARVDIYALGVIMYEMLTGKVPFDRQNSVNILMAHIQEEVPPFRTMNANVNVPPALEAVVRKCMAKSVEARYASMEEVLTAIKQVSGMTQTMSGELRITDLADLSRSVELPLSPNGVAVRGDFASGGHASITHIDSSLFGTVSRGGTPANGQNVMDSTLARDALLTQKKNKLLTIGAGALALAALIGGFVALRPSSTTPATGALVKAKSSEPSAPLPAPAPVPTQAPSAAAPALAATSAPAPPATPAPALVVVSLRSTPAGAMVAVGDREYGPTPTQVEWTGEEATLGREVTFRFMRKGFRDLTVTRQIRGSQLEIDAPPMDPVVLTPTPAAPVRRVERASASPAEPATVSKPAAAAPATPAAAVAPAPSGVPVTPLKGYKAEPY
jgi:eukaryotic-like serine/threonine-protein kinase